MAGLRLQGIRKSYGDLETLHGIDLAIDDGEFVVFVGPSGCGKSTLLRIIAGLEEISAGDLHIGDARVNDVPPAKRGVAMVFQSYALYPHMSVFDNMAFGLSLAGTGKSEIAAAVNRAAKILQIEHLLERKPKALSGGQRQRVAIGRAIVRTPQVFLFDEPLSNLDAALRVQMRIELAKLHQNLQTTMIYVTHDQVEAMTLADRIVVLNGGRIEQVGAPVALYEHPANLFVAGFLGSPKMNFLVGTLLAVKGGLAEVRLAGGETVHVAVDAGTLAAGSAVTLGIRPEHLEAGPGATRPGEGQITGRVLVAEHLGECTYLYLEVAGLDEPLVVRAAADHPARAGERLSVGVPARRAHLFDTAGQACRRIDLAVVAGARSAA